MLVTTSPPLDTILLNQTQFSELVFEVNDNQTNYTTDASFLLKRKFIKKDLVLLIKIPNTRCDTNANKSTSHFFKAFRTKFSIGVLYQDRPIVCVSATPEKTTESLSLSLASSSATTIAISTPNSILNSFDDLFAQSSLENDEDLNKLKGDVATDTVEEGNGVEQDSDSNNDGNTISLVELLSTLTDALCQAGTIVQHVHRHQRPRTVSLSLWHVMRVAAWAATPGHLFGSDL